MSTHYENIEADWCTDVLSQKRHHNSDKIDTMVCGHGEIAGEARVAAMGQIGRQREECEEELFCGSLDISSRDYQQTAGNSSISTVYIIQSIECLEHLKLLLPLNPLKTSEMGNLRLDKTWKNRGHVERYFFFF
jgi:hypothetical protein